MINLLRCLKINTFFAIPVSAFFSVEYTFLLVGWLLPIFQRAIFQLKITLYIEMREGWVNRVKDYWFPLENYGELRTDENVVFCCGYNVPTFSKSTKEVFNVYGALPSPNTLPTMVHGQDFCNIARQSHREGFPYQPPGKVLINGNFISIWLFLFGLYLYFPCVNMLHQCLLNVNIRKFLKSS